jgi:hypothetical protein
MSKHMVWVVVAGCALAAQGKVAFAQSVSDVLGTWEGESKCTIASSPCHDEHVIYEISRASNPAALTLTMDKVVNGERGTMGSLSCHLQESALKCTYKDSHWDFVVNNKQMSWTLKLADGTLYRRISVRKK